MSDASGSRADARFLALMWHPGGLRLVELPPAGAPPGAGAGGAAVERWQGKAPGAFGPGRRYLALWSAGPVVVLAFPGDPRVPALRSADGGATFTPVPPLPGAPSAQYGGAKGHHDGSITVVEGVPIPDARVAPQVLHRLPRGAERWDSVELPAAFNAWDVSLPPSGEPLIGGSERTAGGGRAALLRVTPAGPEAIVPPSASSPGWLRWLRSWMAERVDEPFTRVDAAGEPWLLQQVQGLPDADHSVLSLVHGGRWRTVRLWRDGATVWLRPRPGAVRLVMSQGHLRDTADGGRSWARHDLMPAAGPLLRPASGTTVRVSSAAQHGDDLAVVFTVEDPSRPEPEQLRQTRVLHTADDGRTMRELLRTEGPEEAVVAVAAATFARSGSSSPA